MRTIKIYLGEENNRIEEELLKMDTFELKLASSIMSKWLFLRKVLIHCLHIGDAIKLNILLVTTSITQGIGLMHFMYLYIRYYTN